MNAHQFAQRGWVREHHNRHPGRAAFWKQVRHRWARRYMRRRLRWAVEEGTG